MNAVGAIAVTLEKAKTAEFKQYAQGVLDNAQVIANRLIEEVRNSLRAGLVIT